MRTSPARGRRALVLLVALVALLAGACSSDDGDTAAGDGGGTAATGAPDATVAQGTGGDDEGDGTSTTTGPPRRFSVAATGDFLLHMPVNNSALRYGGGTDHDFSPMFSLIAPEITAADLAICHQEIPLSADSTNLSGYPMFNGPAEIAEAARAAGYDACSTASNHSLDRGMDGVEQTLGVLDRFGLGHAGMARSAEEKATPSIYEVALDDGRSVQVGHLSYTYSFNGIPLPEGAPWAANLIDEDAILDEAARARAEGAEVVLVSLQWGNEYQVEPSPAQVELAEVLLASPDVDAIIGSHVHVVQPVTRIGGKPVIYGLGNILSNQIDRDRTLDGVIVTLHFAEQPDGSFTVPEITYTPTRVEVGPYTIRPVTPESDPASWERTTGALHQLGDFDGTPTNGPAPTTAPEAGAASAAG
jgi:poly-gamma-glutamate synthesis protein (capsule biosynthesis protein)